MNPEKPAQGIYKTTDLGDCVFYTVACDCGNSEHFHDLMVEVQADDMLVTVDVSVSVSTESRYQPFGGYGFISNVMNGLYSRIRNTFDIWVYGKTTHEASIVFNEQAAINYANILKQATKEVKQFRKERLKK